ncbi:MAG: hypothetical protein SPI18_02355 [Prevotella sp.]|nr:hypothetical protein [Prevotella sp.]
MQKSVPSVKILLYFLSGFFFKIEKQGIIRYTHPHHLQQNAFFPQKQRTTLSGAKHNPLQHNHPYTGCQVINH